MPRLTALYRYWSDHPPTHFLAAAYVGHKPKTKGKPVDLEEMFPGGVIR